ncbi:MAG: DUF1622 domain-containing protein [Ignavibacteria bacterium]|jgi:uncharacterized membrane protein|nr:DUF1622 domain-containing protein [Ignavibacteria bacterium]
MKEFIENFAFAISMISMLVIAYGSVLAVFSFIRNEISRIKGKFSFVKLNSVKIDFGYYLLLGLDFLIASDVIRTIVENTLNDLTILGVSVVIRTVLSYFLGREITEDTNLRKEYQKVADANNEIENK